jgi:hypothetical protein
MHERRRTLTKTPPLPPMLRRKIRRRRPPQTSEKRMFVFALIHLVTSDSTPDPLAMFVDTLFNSSGICVYNASLKLDASIDMPVCAYSSSAM